MPPTPEKIVRPTVAPGRFEYVSQAVFAGSQEAVSNVARKVAGIFRCRAISGISRRRTRRFPSVTTTASSGRAPMTAVADTRRLATPPASPNTGRSKRSNAMRPGSFYARCSFEFHASFPSRWRRFALLLLAGLGVAIPRAHAADVSAQNNVMPVPAHMEFTAGRLPVTANFSIAVNGHDDARLRGALTRFLQGWATPTGLNLAGAMTANRAASATLVIECAGPGPAIPAPGEDESYTLEVTARQAVLRAPTVIGAMRGLATVLQLINRDATGWFLPAVNIRDQPRFPWRGLMIDVCRHWQPLDVIERNLDGMALVKLNVLHLHLTDDQGFRIESRTHPELQGKGSDGHYFTQAQMREIIAYAAARGIRVVPEFDIPGHATSWVVSHPELASLPGPYAIERHWGVFNPVLDPTNEATYKLLGDFLGEMAALFPDPCMHIGGDENNGRQWNANPRIQAFIREHGLRDNAGLHAYFNRRVAAILARDGKKLVGWDEILSPGLPHDSVIQSWRGVTALAGAARLGYDSILSNGYYIDLMHPASVYYLVDPLPATTTLTSAEQRRILGGEATMWSEWVTPETIDSRIWPRTAAIAERLWSPRSVRDVPDMYRRLALINTWLTGAGLRQDKSQDALLRGLAGKNAAPAALAALRTFAGLVAPVQNYQRKKLQPGSTQQTPLTGLVDAARADSAAVRDFGAGVNRLLFAMPAPDPTAVAAALEPQLRAWAAASEQSANVLAARAPAAAAMAHALAAACDIGRESIGLLLSGRAPAPGWLASRLAALDRDARPNAAAVDLPLIAPIKLLAAAAAEPSRGDLSGDAWRRHLESVIAAEAKTDSSQP